MARIPEVIRKNVISQNAPIPGASGQGWAALAELSKVGEDFVRPAAHEQAKERGLDAVYRDQDGRLQVDDKHVLGGEMADAHNAAAYAKYLAQRSIDVSESLTELARNHEFDPAGFKEAADGYVNILLEDEDAPKLLKEQIVQGAQREISSRFNGLINSETKRTQSEADRNTKTHRDMLADDYINLSMAGETEAAQEKFKEIEALTDYRTNADFISETPAEQEAYLRGIRGTAKATRLTRKLEDLSGATGISDEDREEIQSIIDDPDISPKVRTSLYAATQGRLKGIDANAIVDRLTDQGYENKVVSVESAGNPEAKAKTSSATGHHQFIKDTWMRLVKKHNPEWARGKSQAEILEMRKNAGASSEMFQHFRAENAATLKGAGLPVNDATEYMAHFFGASGAVDVLSAPPDARIEDIVSSDKIKANGFLKGMTAGDVKNWAARKMVVKASDVAGMRVNTDQIEDQEVRAMADRALMDQFNILRRQEQQAELQYDERLKANDDTLTEQEIREDHSISDGAQDTIVAELKRIRKDQIEVQETVVGLNDPDRHWDIYDSKQRSDVDKAFKAMIDDGTPLSPEGQAAAGEIAVRTGFIPKTMFSAIRSAVNGSDPEALALSMEFLNQVLQRQPGAINPHGNSGEVSNAMSDYAFYSGFMGPTEAAARMIESNTPEMQAKRRNLSDAAAKAAKDLSAEDVTEFMSERYSSVTMGNEVQQAAVMGDYERLFRDAFEQTGDTGLAKNRALTELSRVYGPNQITGDNRLMRFPPQNYYPASPGNPNWMQDQLVDEVSEFAFDGEIVVTNQRLGLTEKRTVSPSRIILNSDQATRERVSAGKSPSYSVSYLDEDDQLQIIPGRYTFDPTGNADADAEFSADKKAELENKRRRLVLAENFQPWITHFMDDQALSRNQAQDENRVTRLPRNPDAF